jgi:hypothetical protein
MQVTFDLNSQVKNYSLLRRLVDVVEHDIPKEITNVACDRALIVSKRHTPHGRLGRIREGWKKKVTRRTGRVDGVIYNANETDSVGRMILRVLERGMHYNSQYIYPHPPNKVLRFTAKDGTVVYATRVRTKDRAGHHMLQKAIEDLERTFPYIARKIVDSHIKRIVGA